MEILAGTALAQDGQSYLTTGRCVMTRKINAFLRRLGIGMGLAAIAFLGAGKLQAQARRPGPKPQAFDTFLKINLPGMGVRNLEILSFSWGPAHRSLTITKKMDAASPKLMAAFRTRRNFPGPVVTLRGGVYRLVKCRITSLRRFKRRGMPMESISFSFAKAILLRK